MVLDMVYKTPYKIIFAEDQCNYDKFVVLRDPKDVIWDHL